MPSVCFLTLAWISDKLVPRRHDMVTATKSFINRAGFIPIQCPSCNCVKKVPCERIGQNKRSIKVKCTCGEVFITEIELRRNYRKQTKLVGELKQILPTGKHVSTCKIKNLSLQGTGFQLFNAPIPSLDDTVLISFHLDNKKYSYIEKKAKVTYVQKETGFVGVEFIDYFNGTQDKDMYYFLKA